MSSLSDRLTTAVTSLETDSGKLHSIVQGAPTDPDVSTDGGAVKPIAKVVAEGEAALAAAVSSLEESATASASAAAASATASATSATNASNSASAAASSATAASSSASNAATSATASATSATASATSATNASNSASAASSSASAAASSASAASASQTAAASSATNAASSATAAATSATNAQTSAASAATSATTALNAIASTFKGGVAGGSVPATSTAAGDYYRVTSAGTSQSKTWATGDLAIYNGTSGNWTQISGNVTDPASLANKTNTLAPRGGVAFDGSNGSSVNAPLTNQQIGLDPFSVVIFHRPPTSAPAADYTVGALSATSTDVPNTSLRAEVRVTSGGSLVVRGSSASYITFANFIALYGGKDVAIALTRDASFNVALYINGVLVATGSGFSDNLNTTFFNVGTGRPTSNPPQGVTRSASLYNLALTQADVTEIFELGGAVPERFKFGSQMARYTSDFSAGTNSWNGDNQTPTGNIDANADGAGVPPSNDWLRAVTDATEQLYQYSNGLSFYISGYAPKPPGSRFRVTADIFCEASSGATHAIVEWTGTGSNRVYVPITAGAVSSISADITSTVSMSPRVVINLNTGGSGSTGYPSGTRLYIKNVRIVELGAVVHLPLDDGMGRQLRDRSTNNLHATMTTTGVAHILPRDDSRYLQTALAANGELLDTGGVVERDGVLVDVVVRNTTANQVSGFALGTASGGDQLTYRTDIPGSTTVILPVKRADLVALTAGTAPWGRVYYSALSWNSGSLNIALRYRRERDL